MGEAVFQPNPPHHTHHTPHITFTGIVEPLQLADASLGYGLGKAEEYDSAAVEATRERRKLDVEVEETEELRQQRQEKHERSEQLKEEIKTMNRSFYCETCDKQYVNVGEFSNHLSSYDHHHTKVSFGEGERAG
jgi:predicted nuclease with TOPRIM domain